MNRRVLAGALGGALLALSPALAACSSDPAGAVGEAGAVQEAVVFDGGHVGADAFAAAVASDGVTVLDVRTPAEFAEGHLPGAVNVDVNDPGFAEAVAALDPEAEYAVYCRSGNRSRTAIDVMAGQGVEMTVGLEGGIGAWRGEVTTG